MEWITITRADASTYVLLTRSDVTAVTKAEQKRTLQGEDVVSMTIDSAVPLDLRLKDWITVYGAKYTLNSHPKITKSATRKLSYDVTWEGRQYDLISPIYLDLDPLGVTMSPDFVLTGNLQFFLTILVNNLNRLYGAGLWAVGTCPDTDYQTLAFSNENCLAVLQRLCKAELYNKEFDIVDSGSVCTINISDQIGTTSDTVFEYGKGKGLYTLTRSTISDKNIISRLFVFGSDKNLRSDYRSYSKRLKLPGNDMSYLENPDVIAMYGLSEDVKIFDNIYPHRTGAITEFTNCAVNQFIDSSMDFDLNAKDGTGNSLYLTGTAAIVHFNTGNLAGYEFEISSFDYATKKFTFKPFTDDRGQAFPDATVTAFQTAIGDSYVLLNILMPDSYVTAAEAELLTAGQAAYLVSCQPRVQYSQTFDENYFKNRYGSTIVNVFGVGDMIHIKDVDVNIDQAIRLKSFTRDVIYHYKYTLQLCDITETSLTEQLISSNINNNKIIIINKLNDLSKSEATTWGEISSWFELMNAGLPNEYLRCKKVLCGDYEIEAFTDSGQVPASWWDSMPVATLTTLGGVKIDGTTITIDENGVISSVGGSGGLWELINGIIDPVDDKSVSIGDMLFSANGIIRQTPGSGLILSPAVGDKIGNGGQIYLGNVDYDLYSIQLILSGQQTDIGLIINSKGNGSIQIGGNADGLSNQFYLDSSGAYIYSPNVFLNGGIPAQSTEINVLFFDPSTGKLSYGPPGAVTTGYFDEIDEKTLNHGVIVDSLLMKDYSITPSGDKEDIPLILNSKGQGVIEIGPLNNAYYGLIEIHYDHIGLWHDRILLGKLSNHTTHNIFIEPGFIYDAQGSHVILKGGDPYLLNETDLDGGNLYLYGGGYLGLGLRGNIFFGDGNEGMLPAKSAETNIVYYDEATGKLSYGAAGSGGSGEASSLVTANFSITEENNKLVFKYRTTAIASMSSTGLITTLDDVETFGTP